MNTPNNFDFTRELRRLMIRRVDTYPKTSLDRGDYGDYCFNSDETVIAIKVNSGWVFLPITNTYNSQGLTVHSKTHNLLDVNNHTDVATYLNQALLTTSNPTFNNLLLNGADIKTDTIAPKDLTITTGANKTLLLNTAVYDDSYFDISPRTTGVGKPTLASFLGNINRYTFAINDISELGAGEILHDWKENTAMDIHVHITTNSNDGTNRFVKYEVDYSYANDGQVFTLNTDSAELQINANTTAKTYRRLTIKNFTPVGKNIGMGFTMSIKRITASGTAPSADPFVFMVGVHYQRDTLGSRFISSK